MKVLSISISLLAVALLLNILPISRLSANAPLTYPVIVARGHRTNQSANIDVDIPLAPAEDGLYRFSVYGTIAKNVTTSGSSWGVSLTWTDDVREQKALLLTGSASSLGEFTNPIGGKVAVFQGRAGQNVQLGVERIGSPDTSEYSIYWEIERLK